MPNILFRADAKPSIGTGDLVSLVQLSRRLPEDWKSYFCTRDNSVSRKILSTRGIDKVSWLPESHTLDQERTQIKEAIDEFDIQSLILEITEIPSSFYQGISNRVFKVCISFSGDIPTDTDLVLDWSVEAHTRYDQTNFLSTKFLLGPEYVILPIEFDDNQFIKRRPGNGPAEKILITMGGNDEWNLTMLALERLSQIQFQGLIKVILGAGYTHHRVLDSFLNHSNLQISIHENAPSMLPFYHWADLSIATGGLTVSELVAARCPSLISAAYEHEASRCRFFANQNWIAYSGIRAINQEILENSVRKLPHTADHFPFHTEEIIHAIEQSIC